MRTTKDLFNSLEVLIFSLEKESKGKNKDEMRGSLHYATRYSCVASLEMTSY